MLRMSKASVTTAMLTVFLLGGCASTAPALSSHALPMKIESARTQADHDLIALFYEKQASTARDLADRHRQLAETYKGPVLNGRGWASMSAHCLSAATSYEKLAEEFDKMTIDHREPNKAIK